MNMPRQSFWTVGACVIMFTRSSVRVAWIKKTPVWRKLGEYVSGLLTGHGVHEEVLEEDLRAAGGRGAALGVILRLDVDGGGHRSCRVVEGCGLAVGTGDTVALGFGCLDDELQVGLKRTFCFLTGQQ